MSLAACIRCWPLTTRSPLLDASSEELLEHGGLSLLDLQEQRIAPVAAEQQHDPGARADAADADHLARDVDQPELLQQLAAVEVQRRAVVAHDLAQLP